MLGRKLRDLEREGDFEKPPGFSVFLDAHDLEVLAEALEFYLECLEPRDNMVNSVCSLIEYLSQFRPFSERTTEIFMARVQKELKNGRRKHAR